MNIRIIEIVSNIYTGIKDCKEIAQHRNIQKCEDLYLFFMRNDYVYHASKENTALRKKFIA